MRLNEKREISWSPVSPVWEKHPSNIAHVSIAFQKRSQQCLKICSNSPRHQRLKLKVINLNMAIPIIIYSCIFLHKLSHLCLFLLLETWFDHVTIRTEYAFKIYKTDNNYRMDIYKLSNKKACNANLNLF